MQKKTEIRKFNRFFGIVLVAVLVVGGVFATSATTTTSRVVFDGRTYNIPFEVVDGYVFLPGQDIANLLGGSFTWLSEFGHGIMDIGGNIFAMTVGGDHHPTVNSEISLFPIQPKLVDDRVFWPIRFVTDVERFDVRYNPYTNTVSISSHSGRLTTLAGVGNHGARDGGRAQFNLPNAVFSFGDGVFVADTYNNLIRKICSEGLTTRHAGSILAMDDTGFPHGFFRNGHTLNSALFNRPMDGVAGRGGRIFIADAGNHAIRMINGNQVSTLTGGTTTGHADGSLADARFNFPAAIDMDSHGNIFVADALNHVIRKISMDGRVSTIAGVPEISGFSNGAGDPNRALFNAPMGIAVGNNGRIYVADTGNNLIRVIDGEDVYTIAGSLVFTAGPGWDDMPIGGFADGVSSMFNQPTGIAIWENTLIVADSANHRIRVVDISTGEVSTLAGGEFPGHSDGIPSEATFHLPMGVEVVGNTLLIADTGNNVIRTLTLRE
ncbi:MAG: stalk domain-containing protein [Defluviitaleaceae bacterium]|nr:stalk domain-containing protein [Defluviitaleaceae bacterium]